MSEPYTELLDPAFRARLERLQIAVRRALPSSLRGDRRSPTRKGLSLEFADFRPYAPGDDVRHLDWSAWARLDQLILKLFHDEEDLQLHLLIDDSASMEMGPPEKALAARRVAAALAWIGLRDGSRVSCTLIGDRLERMNAVRGDGQFDPEYRRLPKPGEMFLWPSFLHHLVHPNLMDEPRISVSFNAVLRRKVL